MPQTQENQAQSFAFAAGSVWPKNRVSETWSRGKNSRLGSSSFKTASHRGFAVCNSTTALGLRSGWVENRGGAYRCARYYDPAIGRFISEDPIRFKGSGTNFYAYVRNSPINLTDPLGLAPPKGGLIPPDATVQFPHTPTFAEWWKAFKDCAVSPDPLPTSAHKCTPVDSSSAPDGPSPAMNNAAGAAGMLSDFSNCMDRELGGRWWP